MDRLIKRYILKAQRDKDNDEVNEGKFNSFFLVLCRPETQNSLTAPQVT